MKRKITIAGFFVAIILLAQMTVVTPPVVADGLSDDEVIILTDEELNRFEEIIAGFSGTDWHDSLVSVYESSLGENNEFKISGLTQMLEILNDAINNIGYLYDIFLFSINDLFRFIVDLIISSILFIPVATLGLILMDVFNLAEYYFMCLSDTDFLVAAAIAIFMPEVYDLLIQLNILKDYYIDIPDTNEEKRQYIIEKLKEATNMAFQFVITEFATFFTVSYMIPKMGYLGEFALYFGTLGAFTIKLVQDTKIKLALFKTIFVDLPKAFIDFVKIREGALIADFIAFCEALKAAEIAANEWYNATYLDGNILYVDIMGIVGMLVALYIQFTISPEKPWLREIRVEVEITKEVEDDITVSFEDPIQDSTYIVDGNSESGNACIYYNTSITENPYQRHTFTVVCTSSNGVIKDTEDWSFSDGRIKIDFDFSKARSKSTAKAPLVILKEKLVNVLSYIQKIFFNSFVLFQNLFSSFSDSDVAFC